MEFTQRHLAAEGTSGAKGARRPSRVATLVVAVAMVLAACLGVRPTVAHAASTQTMYRLYNKWNGDHLFTLDSSERDHLLAIGWTLEGPAWHAPTTGSTVWRLYNRWSGEHLFTLSRAEYDRLVSIGWSGEGAGFKSADRGGTPIYRLYNRWLTAGTHLFTTSKSEYNANVQLGWAAEGIVFYASSASVSSAQQAADWTVNYQGISFTIPEYWRGKVSCVVDDQGELSFYHNHYPDYPVLLMCRKDGTKDYWGSNNEDLTVRGGKAHIAKWDDGGTICTAHSTSGHDYYLANIDWADWARGQGYAVPSGAGTLNDLLLLGDGRRGAVLGMVSFERLLPYMTFS